jgi:hypothetical protein
MNMKKIISTLLMAILCIQLNAQAPQKFNYQGAARDASGNPLSNKGISLRLSILTGSSAGLAQYVETHTITTNAVGLFNVAVGGGTIISGTFAGITWNVGDKYLKVEIDPNGGTNFAAGATNQLLSVPFALNALNPGPQGAPGNPGAPGAAGPANTLTIGTVTNGTTASATISGTAPNQIIDLVLPQGNTGLTGPAGASGPAGPANNITIGTITNGTSASATLTGSAPNQVLNLVLPQGLTGPQGSPGTNGMPGVQGPAGATNNLIMGSVMSGSSASATITGTAPNQTLNLVLPQGPAGPQGNTGLQGPAGAPGATGPSTTIAIGSVTNGASASATLTGTAPNQTLNLVLPQGAAGPAGPAGTYNAGAGIAIIGSTISNTGDLNSTNELQTISLSGNLLSLSNGGGTVTLPSSGGGSYTAGSGISIVSNVISATDNSVSNELQTLSLTGSNLTLSNGGGTIALPSAGGVTSSGTVNYIPKFTGANAIGNSQLFDNGTNVGLGLVLPQRKFDISGSSATSLSLMRVRNNGAGGGIHVITDGAIEDTLLSNAAVYGQSLDYFGIGGSSPDGVGAVGYSNNNIGVYGYGPAAFGVLGEGNVGVYGSSVGTSGAGILGESSDPSSFSGLFDGGQGVLINSDLASGTRLLLDNGAGGNVNDIIFRTSTDSSHISTGLLFAMGSRSNYDYDVDIDLTAFTPTIEPFNTNLMTLGNSNFRWLAVYAQNGTIQTSDIRLKENIRPVSYGLSTLMKLNPISYSWKNSTDKGTKLGFSAQQLEELIPDVVEHTQITTEEKERLRKAGKNIPELSDTYGVRYSELIPVLTKAIQEQQALIEQQAAALKTLEAKVKVLENK